MITREYTVLTPEGLHARPAKIFVNLIKTSESKISLENHISRCNAKSMMGILSLQAEYNTKITVEIDGSDEAELADKVDRFFTHDIIA